MELPQPLPLSEISALTGRGVDLEHMRETVDRALRYVSRFHPEVDASTGGFHDGFELCGCFSFEAQEGGERIWVVAGNVPPMCYRGATQTPPHEILSEFVRDLRRWARSVIEFRDPSHESEMLDPVSLEELEEDPGAAGWYLCACHQIEKRFIWPYAPPPIHFSTSLDDQFGIGFHLAESDVQADGELDEPPSPTELAELEEVVRQIHASERPGVSVESCAFAFGFVHVAVFTVVEPDGVRYWAVIGDLPPTLERERPGDSPQAALLRVCAEWARWCYDYLEGRTRVCERELLTKDGRTSLAPSPSLAGELLSRTHFCRRWLSGHMGLEDEP